MLIRYEAFPHTSPLSLCYYAGTGNTLVSEELGSGDTLDFSHQFVGRLFSREVTVHNMGRRTMTLAWTNEHAEEVKKKFAKLARTAGEFPRFPFFQKPSIDCCSIFVLQSYDLDKSSITPPLPCEHRRQV